MGERIVHATFLGAGPAGVAPFVAADRNYGTLGKLFDVSKVVDGGTTQTIGRGFLGQVHTSSNSTAPDFLKPVSGIRIFSGVLAGDNAEALRKAGDNFVPLAGVAAPFLGEIGQRVGAELGDNLHLGQTITKVRQHGPEANPYYVVSTASGLEIPTYSAVFALGAVEQPRPELVNDERLVMSGDLLTGKRLAEVGSKYRDGARVVFVGSSHSTFAIAHDMRAGYGENAQGEMVVVAREEPKLYYPSEDAAKQDKYNYPTGSVCPVTNKVYRLGGVRGPAAETARQFIGRKDPGLVIYEAASIHAASDELAKADVIVQATGYRAVTRSIYDREGNIIGPLLDSRGHVVVDPVNMNIMGNDGTAIPNVFGIGHGYGVATSPEFGGEPNFKGRADAVIFFQGEIGEKVATRALGIF